MASELYIHTLRQLRDGCKAEHMDTETAALDAAIQALSCDGDCISRQAAIVQLSHNKIGDYDCDVVIQNDIETIKALPSAQPEIIRCKDCIYYDPPHVENNGVRYEYDEMPADAFDALGTGLVTAEYGINIGGRCCVDYYCKNYSDDKRVYVREDNYCGRAERRTDDCKDNV